MKVLLVIILLIVTAVVSSIVAYGIGYNAGYCQVEMPMTTYNIPQTQPSPYVPGIPVRLAGRKVLLIHQGNGLYEGAASEGVVRFIYDYGENMSLFQYEQRAGFLRPARAYEKSCKGLMAVDEEFEARSEDGKVISFGLVKPDAARIREYAHMGPYSFIVAAADVLEYADIPEMQKEKMWVEK